MRAVYSNFVTAIAIAAAVLAVAACGGKEPEPEAAPQAAVQPEPKPMLGEEEFKEGNGPVVESREVTRTISSEIPTVKVMELRGDINRMDATNFMVLGLPETVSNNIIQYREAQGGKYNSVEQLKRVPGMNEELFRQLEGKVAVAK